MTEEAVKDAARAVVIGVKDTLGVLRNPGVAIRALCGGIPGLGVRYGSDFLFCAVRHLIGPFFVFGYDSQYKTAKFNTGIIISKKTPFVKGWIKYSNLQVLNLFSVFFGFFLCGFPFNQ
jgi:hypothetical protein